MLPLPPWWKKLPPELGNGLKTEILQVGETVKAFY